MMTDKLDCFLLAYTSPTFSAAAAKVPMTPQGFTKIIKGLERDLSVTLFAKDESGARKPTAYADELYRYAVRRQEERAQLASAFRRIDDAKRVAIKVACAVGVPGLFGQKAVQGYTGPNGNVAIESTEVPDEVCESLVTEGSYDIALTPKPVGQGFSSTLLYSSPMLMWVNADDSLAGKEELTLGDLSDRVVAMPGKGFRCYENLKRACKERQCAFPQVEEYAEVFWIYRFALAGKGLGFCLPHIRDLDFFSSDRVTALPVEGITWDVCFAWRSDRVLGPEEDAYRKHLEDRAAKLKRRDGGLLDGGCGVRG